jgi:hypothetical protein
MDKAKLETINHFFKVHGISTKRCHEPMEKCDQKAIRAHSIPSSTVLDRLAREGHVVMPKLKLKTPPPSEIQFKRIGANKATTFTGLCAKHDNYIFRPIDDALPDLTDNSHLFLLAYRAVLREYHVVLQNALRFQSTYLKRVEVGLSTGTMPCDFGMFATTHLLSKLILQFCDNFVIDPEYYDSMLQEQREAIERFYIVTAFSNNEDYENERLFLF